MNVVGSDLLRSLSDERQIKFILNEAVIALFPAKVQHSDFAVGGAVYADDSRGNALAGILFPDHIEIRLHRQFSFERVQLIWTIASSLIAVADRPALYGKQVLT